MAQDIENKKTTLEDDAEIYSKERPSEERLKFSERWKKMDAKEKKTYFFDYMLKPILIGIVAAVILIMGAVNVYKKAGRVYYRFSVTKGTYMDHDKLQAHVDELSKRWNLGKRQRFRLDDEVGNFTKNASTTSATLLDNLIYTGAVDLLIGTMSDLKPVIPYCQDLNVFTPEAIKNVPEEAKAEITFYSADPYENNKEITGVMGVWLKYTCLADSVAESYGDIDNLLIVFPEGDLNAGALDKDEEVLNYLFET